jgi:anti-sigma regulatory factor (Ser/Thr protein kinase)
METELRMPLPARSADAPAAARRFVVRALGQWHCDEDVTDDASIVTTELVSNAVEHTGRAEELRIRRTAATVVIEVSDASPKPPRPRAEDDPGAARGRGLLLVQRIAARWGIRWTKSGKTIWAELATAPLTALNGRATAGAR